MLAEAVRHGNDAELFAGLVHACRYCGLNEESIAAHSEARRLDPNVPTSLQQTLLMAGDVDRLLAAGPPRVIAGADDGILVIGLGLAGRRDEARRKLVEMRQASRIPLFASWIEYLGAWLDGRGKEMLERTAAFGGLKIHEDPEGMFQQGWLLCDAGEYEIGLDYLRRGVTKGYFVSPTLSRWPQFERLRREPEFLGLVEHAEAGRSSAGGCARCGQKAVHAGDA